jgi:hypothetical protein
MEEKDVEEQLGAVAKHVKNAVEAVLQSLHDIDKEKDDRYESGLAAVFNDSDYKPQRIGRVDRLLMKLDFGGWFDTLKGHEENFDHDSNNDDLHD